MFEEDAWSVVVARKYLLSWMGCLCIMSEGRSMDKMS
jgi:hypothetical protein